jgi:hypothetical protein
MCPRNLLPEGVFVGVNRHPVAHPVPAKIHLSHEIFKATQANRHPLPVQPDG